MRGARPGPRPTRGHPGRMGSAHTPVVGGPGRRGLRPSACPAAFLRTPGPPLPRGPCPGAGPLRRGPPAAAVAARVRGLAPSLRSPGPGLGPPPRLPRSGTCAPGPLPRLRGLSLPPAPWALPSLRCGLPVVALAPARGAAWRGPWARRGPPWAARCAAPGPAAPAPGAWAALGSARAAFSRPGPRGLLRPLRAAARVLSPAALPVSLPVPFALCLSGIAALSPAAPPPRPPPLGAPGEPGASSMGPRPAGTGPRISRPCPAPLSRPGGPRPPIFGGVDKPKIVNRAPGLGCARHSAGLPLYPGRQG